MIKESYVYYAIVLASCFYSCYTVSHYFNFRILSFASVFLFYLFLFTYVLERNKISQIIFKTNGNIWIKIYLISVLIILVLSVSRTLEDNITLFFHPLAFLAFFISSISLITNRLTFGVFKKIVVKINNIFLFYVLIDFSMFSEPVLTSNLSSFTLFEFLFIDKLKFNRKIYISLLMILNIVIQNYFDNRTIVVRLVATSICLILLGCFSFLNNKYMKYIYVLSSIIFLCLIVLSFEMSFSYIVEMIGEKAIETTDTRSFLFIEFFEDFKPKDWIAGRGFLGSYFSKWFYNWQGDNGDYYNRFSIEVGILQILLKGGGVLLLPFIVVMLKALKKGFVNQTFSTATFRLGLLIVIQFMLMGIENIPTFDVNYMIMWLSIGIIFYHNEYEKRIKLNQL